MKKSNLNLRFICLVLTALLFNSCTTAQTSDKITIDTTPSDLSFAKGADVSWLPQMEATGYRFYNSSGSRKDCLQLLKDIGMNTIRLRVFVNPSDHKINGHCSPIETVALAVRAKNMGMRIMINFHYSDTWADPAHQTKPAAWANHSFEELKNDVYKHTFDVLTALKIAGVTPEWVQVGNEIPSGMLWPEGHIDNWGQLGALIDKGYEATKTVDPTIKVIVHVDQGNDNGRFRWFFDNIKENNVKYDVIGMSYYPFWLGEVKGKEALKDYMLSISSLENNLKDMVVRYGKEVMVVEVGGDYTLAKDTKNMLTAVISAVKEVPNNKGLGVLYWEPQGEKNWSNYQLNAWQSNGNSSLALDSFKN